MTLRPIETHYHGYRFRSRLEARWAVFFEALGLAYRYEPEGFRLADGTAYLPDFFLPAWDAWVEIKPLPPSAQALARYRLFDTQGSSFVLLYGDIYDACYGAWIRAWQPYRTRRRPGDDACLAEWVSPQASLARCAECVRGWYLGDTRPDARLFVLEECPTVGICRPRQGICPWQMQQAYDQARSARFDHGETPIIRPVWWPTRLLSRCPYCGNHWHGLELDSVCRDCAACATCHRPLNLDTRRCMHCVLCPECQSPVTPATGLCPDCAHCAQCWGELLQPRAEDGALLCPQCSYCARCGAFIAEDDVGVGSTLCGWCTHMQHTDYRAVA